MQSKATTVEQYLAELPEDRRAAIQAIREVIRANLPAGIAEGMQYGMIGYFVPHSVYPPGYHCDPKLGLPFASLASQKNYISVYLMTMYAGGKVGEYMRQEFEKRGKKLDLGKCCIRFKRLEDLPLDVLAEAVRKVSVADYIQIYEDARKLTKARKK